MFTEDKSGFSIEDKVREYLPRYGNCAQASFSVLQEQFNLDSGPIIRALSPFPGIARRGESCGAVVGSLLALGLVYGEEMPADPMALPAVLSPAREFCQRFVQARGSTMCVSIVESMLGKRYDLSDLTGFQAWVSAGGPERCMDVVIGAVHIASTLIKQRYGARQ